MRDLDRLLLRAGRNNELRYCECKFDDGEDYSYYVKPITAAQMAEAQKGERKGEVYAPDSLDFAVKLFCLRALDANGTRKYQADAFPTLRRIPLEILTVLVGAMNVQGENEEAPLDMKSTDEPATEEPGDIGGAPRSRKARNVADAIA